MRPKIIRTEVDYTAALQRIEALMENDPEPTSAAGEELDLLSLLVERYEDEQFPMDLPDPLSAIKFRMQQQGLKGKDLIPYIGSASKVSEVLSGQRTLSLTMIRNLVTGLDIPAEVLLKEPGAKLPVNGLLAQGAHFPLAEMVKRGWFPGFEGTLAQARQQLEELLISFAGALGQNALLPTLNRQHVRNGSEQDVYALLAWRIRVVTLAQQETLPPYRPGTVTTAFLRELAHLSYLNAGPRLAQEYLNKSGIHLVFERHLPQTHLDGTALKLPDGAPVVALTLRHDRLDHFWFTLLHELAHVALHLDKEQEEMDVFFDDLSTAGQERCEQEADQLATDSLIPPEAWQAAQLTGKSQPKRVLALVGQLRISPAIPAGRIRHETNDFRRFGQLIGSGQVREIFGIRDE